MSTAQIEILQRDQLHEGGFAGLREHRLVMDPKAWGRRSNADSWKGIGNFVYLADARFNPLGETTMHPHKEIDVISVMVEGRVAHEGSLEHGSSLNTGEVQVQRAGGEGFSHNEVNPDSSKNRMLQLWVLPEIAGEAAAYKKFNPVAGEVSRVYGGKVGETTSFAAQTCIDVARLKPGQTLVLQAPYLAYVVEGQGIAADHELKEGDLIRGESTQFAAETEVTLIRITHNS